MKIRFPAAGSFFAIAALVSASGAAEITKVRVGNHPTYTRVVFELDAPAGYRIERSPDRSGDASSILVTMEATSEARTVGAQPGMVESVTVEEQLGRAVARIHLRKPKLRLKEMILANPPRIVLDVMHESSSGAVVKPPSAAVKPPSAAVKPPSAAVKPPKWGGEIAAPAPKSGSAASSKPSVSEPVPSTVKPAALEKPIPREPVAPRTVTPEAGEVDVARPSRIAPITRAKPIAPAPVESGTTEGSVAPVIPTPATKSRPLPKTATLPPAQPKSAAPTQSALQKLGDQVGVSPTILGAGTVGAVLAVVGFVFFRRRRRPSRATEYDERVDLFLRDDESEDGFTSGDVNAPAGRQRAESDATVIPSFGDPGEGGLFGDLGAGNPSNPQSANTPVVGPGGGLFGDDEKEESNVDQMSTPMGGMGASGEPGAYPPAGDLARVVAELERRLNSVETRLDESVDACERLERQMAAQSEELRVQRAAIARTQRALRSMSRSDEEQATEPAIREPR